ncbi:hypothetical protein VZO05_07830 [Aggregatilineales bacterium SYSU G02658]
MEDAKAWKDQKAIRGLIQVFETMIIKTVDATESVAFEPLMVIDMRSNMFEAFIISLRPEGTFYSIPRAIEVEEAHQISVPRLRTTMCAYRKKKSQNWIVCSENRLREKVSEPDFEVVEGVLNYGLTLFETDRPTLERLWHAFLSKLVSTDSGQDYNQVVFVVDNEDVVPVMEQLIVNVGEKIDRYRKDKKWQFALVACVDTALDMRGFVFLNTPRDLQASQGLYLLLHKDTSAVEAAFDGTQFSYKSASAITLDKYRKIAIVGVAAPAMTHPNVIHFPEEENFLNACLIGYLQWWLQINDARLEELRHRHKLLAEQLDIKKKETKFLALVLDRLKKVLQRIKQ